MSAKRAVLVTTIHKGVFFGYLKDYKFGDETVYLQQGRCCISWSKDMKGFMGLAAFGPSNECKIGPAADIELRDVTSIVEVVPDAVLKWEKAPWSQS